MKKTVGLLFIALSLSAHAANFPAIFAPILGYEKLTDNTTLVQGQLDRLVIAHNDRFDSQGQYVATEEETQKFIQLQDETIAELRRRNAYQFLFPITNNLVSSANGEAFFVLDEQKNLLAFTVDGKSSKSSVNIPMLKVGFVDPSPADVRAAKDEDKILKIRPVHYLSQVQSIIGLDGDPVLVLESKTKNWTNGGELRIYCMTDKKKKKYSVLKVTAAKNAKGEWKMFYNNIEITKMNLKLWVNVFSQNGGVSEVTVNGNVKVALEVVARTNLFAASHLY